MFTIESEVHCLLSLKTCTLIVVRTSLCLDNHALVACIRVEFLVADTIAVFPVVTTVVYTLERYFVQWVELVVECERIALALTGYIILTHLSLFELHFALLLHIFKLGIIRTAWSILIRGTCHDTEFVVEEAVAPCSTNVPLRFTRNPCISR